MGTVADCLWLCGPDRWTPHHGLCGYGQGGQRAIVAADYGQIPAVLNAPDMIRKDEEKEEIIYEKWIGNERHVAVFAPFVKRKMLHLKSMRIHVTSPRLTS